MTYKKLDVENNPLSIKNEALDLLNQIINKLPYEIKELIEQAFVHKRIPKEYLFSSMLFAFSNAAGLAFKLQCGGYTNYCNLYHALVGSRGDVKSEAMSLAVNLLKKKDDEYWDEFVKSKKEAKEEITVLEEKPIERKQFFLQNATIEAANYTHLKNPFSIGLFVDEIKYLIDKMANNNNNEGAQWRTFFLQGYTNQHIDISRKTTDSYRISDSYPTLLGGIQTQFISNMFANGNLESGFIDRVLFTTPLTHNNKLSKTVLSDEIINNYNISIENLLNYRRSIEEAKTSFSILLDKDSQEMIHDYVQGLITKKSSLPSIQMEYNAKMQISIYKFIILVHLMVNSLGKNYQSRITIKTVDLAILINEFYFLNFKIIINQNDSPFNEKSFTQELVKRGIKNGADQKDVVKVSGKSKGYISKLWNRHTT